MSRTSILCAFVALTAFVVIPAQASSVSVTNYNWDQLPLSSVTASAGGVSTGGTGGVGTPLDFRVGDPQWIPGSAFTGSGTGDYYAQLTFDQLRNVQAVTLDWWASTASTLSKYTIQGSTDGVNFTDISALTSYSRSSDHGVTSPVITSPGNYKAVRVLVKAGDYTYDTANGGRAPGLEGFDVRGDGSVLDSQVNWANQPTFSTVVTNSGLDLAGTRLNDGNLYDDESVRTGDASGNPWNAGDYTQIDLGAVRAPKQIVLVWDALHIASSVTFLGSLDGTNFQTITQLGAPTASGDVGGYDVYNVAQTDLRYLRVEDASNGTGFQLELLNQVMVFGVPEPASLSMLAVGGLLVLRRRRGNA